MTNAYIIERRAFDPADCQAMFHRLDASKWAWAGEVFLELGRPSAAERCFSFAQEHLLTADRLSGAAAIGAAEDDAEITRDAIAFGGPLPTGRVA